MSAAAPSTEFRRVQCAEVFGGIEVLDLDVCTRGLSASIHSTASGARKGGDVYYFSVCSSDLLTRVVVADVRGHGEKVSHLSGWLYESLQQRMNTLDGGGVLADLNALCHRHGFDAMTTAAVFSYYIADSNLYFSYAGHPPAFIRTGAEWRVLPMPEKRGPANLPLGALGTTRYDQEQVRVGPGDRLFVYTDGLTECTNAEGEFFGDTRLAGALERAAREPLVEVKNAVAKAVAAHAGGSVLDDDCTFMAIEVNASVCRAGG